MKKSTLALISAATITQIGCGSYSYGVYPTGYNKVKSERFNQYVPAINDATTIDVGQSLILSSAAKVVTTYSIEAIEITQDINTTASGVSGTYPIALPAGSILEKRSNDPRGSFFVYPTPATDYFAALFFPNNVPDSAKACYHRTGSPGYYGCSDYQSMTVGTHFRHTQKTMQKQTFDEVKPKRELIFQGGSPKEVRLLFREFTDGDLIKPAFTQNLTYDISKDRLIGFKSMRIEILEASNTSLKYKITRHWD